MGRMQRENIWMLRALISTIPLDLQSKNFIPTLIYLVSIDEIFLNYRDI